MKLPLFLRFYLGIIAVFFISIYLSIWLYESYLENEDYEDFLHDTQHVANLIQLHLKSNTSTVIDPQFVENFGITFRVDVISENTKSSEFEKYQFLRQHDDIDLYQLQNTDNDFLAVYPIENSTDRLVIADLLEHDDDTGGSTDLFLDWGVIGILHLGLIFVIYVLSRGIKRPVRQLVEVANAYGKTNFSIRADESAAAPIGELGASFNNMANRLQELHSKQAVMTHAIAHEIRTPLMRMQMALGMVDKSLLDKKSIELLDNTDQYMAELESLTNSVLTLGKISNAQPDQSLPPFNIGEFAIDRINNLAKNSNIDVEINVTTKLYVKISAAHIQLIIDNLVNNALFYARSKILINDRLSDDVYQLCISDDGNGIIEAERSKVFTPFYRSDNSRDQRSGGFGLGLAIAFNTVKHYGGTIRVGDSPLAGAQFILEFKKDVLCSSPEYSLLGS